MWVESPKNFEKAFHLPFGLEPEDAIFILALWACVHYFLGGMLGLLVLIGGARAIRQMKFGKPPGWIMHECHHWFWPLPGILRVVAPIALSPWR